MLDRVITTIGVLACITVLWILVLIGVILETQRQCQKLGYRDGVATYAFDRYCIRRINQTDYVVPLKEAVKQ